MRTTLHATFAIALAALVAMSAVPAGATTTQTTRYAVGLGQDGCSASPHDLVPVPVAPDVHAMGVCQLPIQPGTVTVQVIPDAGSARFYVSAYEAYDPVTGVNSPPDCMTDVQGDGEVTFDLPADCATLSVSIAVGGVSGTIVVTQP